MVCAHLATLEKLLLEMNIKETQRGQLWSKHCREWVYFDCVLDVEQIARALDLDACVRIHQNDDPKSGREKGFVCEKCLDGVIGIHPLDGADFDMVKIVQP